MENFELPSGLAPDRLVKRLKNAYVEFRAALDAEGPPSSAKREIMFRMRDGLRFQLWIKRKRYPKYRTIFNGELIPFGDGSKMVGGFEVDRISVLNAVSRVVAPQAYRAFLVILVLPVGSVLLYYWTREWAPTIGAIVGCLLGFRIFAAKQFTASQKLDVVLAEADAANSALDAEEIAFLKSYLKIWCGPQEFREA